MTTRVSRNRARKELIKAGELVIQLLEHQLATEELPKERRQEIELDLKLLQASVSTMSLSSNG